LIDSILKANDKGKSKSKLNNTAADVEILIHLSGVSQIKRLMHYLLSRHAKHPANALGCVIE
jgi:tRNA threonylcarbamoyladenosine modification (KEOPS) complex Cgi121 subunit